MVFIRVLCSLLFSVVNEFFLNNIITPFRGLCSNVAAGCILNKVGKQCYNIV